MSKYKGKFKPKNPKKYKGDSSNIIYRSLLERRFMSGLDLSDEIVEWNSEEVVVPYLYEVDMAMHRYFVDFYVKTKSGEMYLIEIKPYSQTLRPKKTKNTNKYIMESQTYIKNKNKWEHATRFAKSMGMEFIVITEKDMKQYKYINELLKNMKIFIIEKNS